MIGGFHKLSKTSFDPLPSSFCPLPSAFYHLKIMSDAPQPLESTPSTSSEESSTSGLKPVTPLQCLIGAIVAGGLSYLLYRMTTSIAVSFATHKIASTSLIVQRVSSAVRTLVVGMATLGTGVFGLAAIGLFALAIQIVIQRTRIPSDSSNP